MSCEYQYDVLTISLSRGYAAIGPKQEQTTLKQKQTSKQHIIVARPSPTSHETTTTAATTTTTKNTKNKAATIPDRISRQQQSLITERHTQTHETPTHPTKRIPLSK